MADIQKTRIEGFHGQPYVDQLRDMQTFTDDVPVRTIDAEIDRIYQTENAATIIDQARGLRIQVEKVRVGQTVLWNPWTATKRA